MYLIAIDKKIISLIVKWKKIALRHDGIFAEKLYFSILTTTLLIINQKGFKFDNENRNVKMIYLKRSVFKKIAKNDLQIHDQKKKIFFTAGYGKFFTKNTWILILFFADLKCTVGRWKSNTYIDMNID